ncbi:putative WRKY transcription factor 19 [Bienertia sinuspersici]
MDDTHLPFVWNSFSKASKDLNEIDVGLKRSSHFVDTTLSLNSHSVVAAAPHLYDEGTSKRKGNAFDDVLSSKPEISLALELGANYAGVGTAAVSSRIDSDTQSPMDICLDLNMDLGSIRVCKDMKKSGISLETSNKERPKVDLELSLSTGATESDLTSVTLTSWPIQNLTSESEQLVDDGSTSSKWKQGHLVPHLDRSNGDLVSPVPSVSAISANLSLVKTDDAVCHSRQQRKTSIKTCQFPGCQKGARGASGHCISHGGGRRCQRPGCQKGAEGRTAFCKAHGGGRRCEHLGCTKSAEGRTSLCIAHGGGKRCSFHGGCNRAARGKTGLCIRHGGGKRCKIENCTKSAEGLAGLCIAHGGGRRCQFPACTKGAQGSTKFCKAHGGGKRCTFLGCTKGAEGSTDFCKGHGGGKRCSFQGGGVCTKSVHGGTLYCVSHGGGKRCAVPECTKSARGRTNFCVRHGGGKRCKFEGCEKSAQGSTDFCKGHGGGKRCLWGQQGSGYGGDDDYPCDKFARGKIGLCAAHGALVQDMRVHGDGIVGLKMKGIATLKSLGCTSNVGPQPYPNVWNGFNLPMNLPDDGPWSGQSGESANAANLEERVHGGGLMAMLGHL